MLNAGLSTFDDAEVEELTKLNYASARRAIVKQAQGQALVEAAERQARTNVERHFEMALRAAGRADVRVVATFGP